MRRLVVASAAVLFATACSGKPSASEVETALRASLRDSVPAALVSADIGWENMMRCETPDMHTVEIRELRVVEIQKPIHIGDTWPKVDDYPARVFVDGTCVEAGQRHDFAKEVVLVFTRDSDGKLLGPEK